MQKGPGIVVRLGILALLLAYTFGVAPARAQESPAEAAPVDSRTPMGALWRAAVLPGWGQAYNGQYVKLPFVYGAIGGLIYLAIVIDGNYDDYRRAYLFKAYQERVDAGVDESNPWAHFKPSYDDIAGSFGPISSTPLRNQRDAFRRNRDLTILGAGLAYALTILDAYVSAHLLDFDVGENLSVRMRPAPSGVSVRATISFP